MQIHIYRTTVLAVLHVVLGRNTELESDSVHARDGGLISAETMQNRTTLEAYMANDRLRTAMARPPGYTCESLALALGVDPSTVQRWVSGERVPRVATCAQVATLLGVSIDELWPELARKAKGQKLDPDFFCLYPQRGDVPAAFWGEQLEKAAYRIWVLAFSAQFLPDGDAEFPKRLVIRAAHRVDVRLLFGNPKSAAVELRGLEEGIGAMMAGRIELVLGYIADAFGVPGIEIRLHGTTLYNSIYIFDDEMLVNVHTYGAPAVQSPVLHLKQRGGRLFAYYMAALERVWALAVPAEKPRKRS